MMKDALKFQVKYAERNTILVSDTAPCHYQCVECRSYEFCTLHLSKIGVCGKERACQYNLMF